MDIRLLTPADIPAGMRLKELANWNQTERDWQRLLELEPRGCFAAIEDGRLVGTATTTSFGTDLAWIGMVLVDPEYRRRGIATRLMKTAMEYLHSMGVATIKLDATPAGLPVYEALGFVFENKIERLMIVLESKAAVAFAYDPMNLSHVPAFDRPAFGGDRSKLLKVLIADAVIEPATVFDKKLLGFALARSGAKAHYIGPIVAVHESVAEQLLARVLEQLPAGNAYLDCIGYSAVDLQRFGFSKQRELYRMRFGPPLTEGTGAKVFAIAGPEVG